MYLDADNVVSYAGTGTTWKDLTTNGNNGTLVNGVGYSGSNGGSLVFDGVNDYVNLDSVTLNMSLPWTISFWSYLLTPFTQYPEVITLKTNLSHPFEIAFSNNPSYLGITFGSPSTIQRKNGVPLSIYINKWTYVCLTYLGNNPNNVSNFILYDMGIVSVTSNAAGYGTITNQSVLCGGTGTSIHWFRGNLAQTQLYNRALSASEVLQNFNATRARFGV
jgi:hypothetical protein